MDNLKKRSKVSIIIPAFNSEKYIRECIDSCLNQTYKDIEIVTINDGSTDSTGEILNAYAKEKEDIFISLTIKNSGPATARKIGLNSCTGNYIFFLDADDYIKPTAIELLIQEVLENNCDLVVGQYILRKENKTFEIKNFQLIEGPETVIRSFLMQKLPFTLWPILYKKEVFKDVSFSEEITVGEDFLINCQIFSQETIKAGVIFEPIYTYRRHDNSITKTVNSQKVAQNYQAYIGGIKIIEEKVDLSKLSVEVCFNKMVFLYSSIFIKSPYLFKIFKEVRAFSLKEKYLAWANLNFKAKLIISLIILFPFMLENNRLFNIISWLK